MDESSDHIDKCDIIKREIKRPYMIGMYGLHFKNAMEAGLVSQWFAGFCYGRR